MKFQNCILINFVTDARTDGRTHTRTNKAEAICPFNFSKVGGHKKDFRINAEHKESKRDITRSSYAINKT